MRFAVAVDVKSWHVRHLREPGERTLVLGKGSGAEDGVHFSVRPPAARSIKKYQSTSVTHKQPLRNGPAETKPISVGLYSDISKCPVRT